MKVKLESRKVAVPPHRMTPLKNVWSKIYPPLVEHLKLQVRMNLKTKTVELRTNKYTTDVGALQKVLILSRLLHWDSMLMTPLHY